MLMKKTIAILITCTLLAPSLSFADDYNELEVSGVPVLKRESRIIEQTNEAAVLEGLRIVLIKYGYDVKIYSHDLGVITGVYNEKKTKDSSKIKNSLLGGITMGLPSALGPKDVPDEMYATILTKQVGANKSNVLIQGRFNKVQWDKLGKIRQSTGVESSGMEQQKIFYLLGKELSKPVKEMK